MDTILEFINKTAINYVIAFLYKHPIIIVVFWVLKQIVFTNSLVKKLFLIFFDSFLSGVLAFILRKGYSASKEGSLLNTTCMTSMKYLNNYRKEKNLAEIEFIKGVVKEAGKKLSPTKDKGIFTKYKHPRDFKIRPKCMNRKRFFEKHFRKIVRRPNVYQKDVLPRRSLQRKEDSTSE